MVINHTIVLAAMSLFNGLVALSYFQNHNLPLAIVFIAYSIANLAFIFVH